ncbi:MAG TPA: hypothetical protein DDW20_04355 [Firmicutes bacterium]|nr:hypothetical protein [Bacillota bacterium]
MKRISLLVLVLPLLVSCTEVRSYIRVRSSQKLEVGEVKKYDVDVHKNMFGKSHDFSYFLQYNLDEGPYIDVEKSATSFYIKGVKPGRTIIYIHCVEEDRYGVALEFVVVNSGLSYE